MVELERAFGITAKLREVRDTMRELHGDRYTGLVAPWKNLLRREMKIEGCSALLAATRFIKRDFPHDGAVQAMLVSAAVEIIETDESDAT